MKREISAADRAVARHLAATLDTDEPRVNEFLDMSGANQIAIFSAADRPTEGLTTTSTVGLHNFPNMLHGTDVRIELAGVAPTVNLNFANVIATCAFFVMKDRWLAAPGVVFPGMLTEYNPSTVLPHVLWCPPFPWIDLNRLSIEEGYDVHWLIAVPISEPEREFLVERGWDALEKIFEEHDLAYYDPQRRSIL